MEEKKYPVYAAKIKIVEQRWHGWSPEGANIAPVETVVERISGSYLTVARSRHTMSMVWGEESQSTEEIKRCDYEQKEGFRVFIPRGPNRSVTLTPERTLKPISGEEFPINDDLPLERKSLKTGESMEIKPHSMDMGVRYTITVLDIYEKG